MNLFKVSIITPEGTVFEDVAESLAAPGVNGEFTIMAQHAPLVAATQAGVLKIVKQSRELFFAVGESLVEVTKEQTLVLANLAHPASNREEAKKQADVYLKAAHADTPNI
ncbi:MAG: hypothetical protein A2X46_04570 [Lentisphaerae bacterium GWF2_57_35]|nr:MAG: hypothetical protein A2X46_04570 [Lentisphaerae bacterium GWF2_57_35]